MNERPQLRQHAESATPDEFANNVVWLENRRRYIEQSAKTTVNNPAPLPERSLASFK